MTTQRKIYIQGIGWLLLLAPFFFLTYGQVNQFTASRENIGSMVFDWERHIPFIPLTVIPYWSLDLLYGLSLFFCATLNEQRRLVCKLLLASLIACVGFLLFPMQFTFTRPEASGLAGWLFSQLEQFDLPYNQSPSLHIILCWLLWTHFNRHLKSLWKKLNSVWFLLIAISVLTTWQHHFIDVISGLAVGMVIDWMVPLRGQWHWRIATGKRRVMAVRYLCGSLLCLAGTLATLWLWWPTVALLIVAMAYGVLDVQALQKDERGKLTPAVWWLLFPWRAGMTISRHFYIRRLPVSSLLTEGLFIGAYPQIPPKQQAVLDLTCEYPRAPVLHNVAYRTVPMLDLVTPDGETVCQAVDELDRLRKNYDSVLVHCALGLSRSALIAAAWLLRRYPELSVADAISHVQRARWQVVFTPEHVELLERWKANVTL